MYLYRSIIVLNWMKDIRWFWDILYTGSCIQVCLCSIFGAAQHRVGIQYLFANSIRYVKAYCPIIFCEIINMSNLYYNVNNSARRKASCICMNYNHCYCSYRTFVLHKSLESEILRTVHLSNIPIFSRTVINIFCIIIIYVNYASNYDKNEPM